MSIEQNIENLEIRNANVVTFVGSSSTIVDTISGRIQCKGFQHNSNVITDISGPHGRVAPTLKKYPEIIFADGKFDSNDSTNTYVQAGYTVTDSSHHNEYYGAWIFDDQTGFVTNKNLWISPINTYTTSGGAGTPTMTTSDARCTTVSGVATPGEWVQLKLPNKVKLSSISIMGPTGNGGTGSQDLGRAPKDAVLAGSVDGITWNSVLTWSGVTDWALKAYKSFPANVDSTNYYNYFRIIVTKNDGTHVYASIQELQLYGYEENPPAGDHSVDTTFKSRFNNPQLTGVQVFVDGKGSGSNQISGGPDVTGTTTYNESGKHWELNGQLTSNITMEANTFLEGDQPHAVSVWFNSSNLEANVSNTCVFSVSDQEHLNSENLDLQSNTWHNLTYAYQGEGGSRVTYLDGRKVAEDQAEDTFGDYPPFAMTGYSQGGYVVSASSQLSTYVSWFAFDDETAHLANDNSWICHNSPDRYHRTSGVATSDADLTTVDGVPKQGEWIQMEFPNKMCLSYIALAPQTDTEAYRSPKEGVIAGSNDGTTWETLHAFANQTSWTDNVFNNYVVNTNVGKGYRYVRIIVEKVQYDGTHNDNRRYTAIADIKLYGHRENDLVRLPDPTNVLKYPHIDFPIGSNSNDPTGIRGYVASASSSSNSGIGRRPWSAFNDLGEGKANLGGLWQNAEDSSNHKYTPQTTGLATTNADHFEGVFGEWIKLELPHKLKVSQVYILTSGAHEGVEKAILYGSNDDIIWDVIKDSGTAGTGFTFTLTVNGGLKEATESVTTSKYYKYLLLQVTEVVVGSGSSDGRSLQLYKLQYYGTEEATSVPIQIGGGNIDKVANFRVYDKFIGEDQALEIWDAQKEEFGRAKPQMVLQQGKLGIGTDAPQGSLSVADEPDPTTYGLQEFPPKPLSDSLITHIEGHGIFKVYASVGRTGTNGAVNLFDKKPVADGGSFWLYGSDATGNGAGYNLSSGAYEGESGTIYRLGAETSTGQYATLEMPYPIKLEKYSVGPRSGNEYQTPKDWELWGSNDGSSWTKLHNVISNAEYVVSVTYDAPQTNYYRHFGFVVTRTIMTGRPTNHDYFAVGELKFFGYREQVTKQSVLHDGQLTLTKNLTVPRIGPALDADDTPRRDRLVAEYNTSTNPTFDGAVRDTSGRGNDGVLVGGAYYDANAKAFEFDGSNDHIKGNAFNSGDFDFTVSCWVNRDSTSSTDVPWFLGSETQNSGNNIGYGVGLQIGSSTDPRVFFFIYGGFELEWANGSSYFTPGQWNHVVCTRRGLVLKLYLNGILQNITEDNSDPLELLPNSDIRIGRRATVSNANHLDGSLSQFKLYDTDLTASEVKTLYDMGRCDDGHHVVNFSKTRVGIGLGDGEAPTYTLDVRGQIRSQGSLVTSFTGQHKCIPDEPMEKGLIVSAKKNQFVKLNGLAIGKSAITIDESLPIVSLSNVVQDKACFGVVSATEEANTTFRVETTNGGVISTIPKTLGDNRAIVNSVGEGAIWVVDTGGSLESGDYITTSNVAGYGQKQDGAGLMNYTVAKITMDCDFTASNVTVQTIKREETGLRTITEDAWNQLVDYDRSSNTETQYSNTLVSSAYTDQPGYVPREVTTIVDYTDGSNLISVAEWSDLESNIQNTYQSNTFTEIVDYTKFVNLSEWSNLTAETQATYSEAEITTYYQIQRGGNVLDENGQLQFEDKTGATEAPYEKRFLTVDGTQTDEANAVHIAAFVGCTYHCG